MHDWIGAARLWRMCRKELRETLRDRRTVVTLILMPILVYPLLSITLQRMVVSSGELGGEAQYVVGVTDEATGQRVQQIVQQGLHLAEIDSYLPMRVAKPSASRLLGGPTADSQIPPLNLVLVESEVEQTLKQGGIDLWVRTAEQHSEAESPGGQGLRFEVSYQSDSLRSQEALDVFRQLLQRINEFEANALRQQSGMPPRAPLELSAAPMEETADVGDALVAVIPLVLLLMTITGAVYPAIDLTAGERERGTMEALIASPVPRFGLLLSKYVAVVSVASLTALANLGAMWITLTATGLGQLLLGESGFSLALVGLLLPLLVIFASFFSAILLGLCSFAKSFKEAQAYLIPIMLLSLAPGVLSLMPGVRLSWTLACVPLVNIVLLARDLLTGLVNPALAAVAVVSTLIYAAASLGIAARLFGSDAAGGSGQGGWEELWRRPRSIQAFPRWDQMALFLAMVYPIHFLVSNLAVDRSGERALDTQLGVNAVATGLIFGVLPLLYALWRRLSWRSTFRLAAPPLTAWTWLVPAMLLLAGSAWMGAHQLVVLGSQVGLGGLDLDLLEGLSEYKERFREIPLPWIWLTLAIVPAVAEELFFRGLVLSGLQRLGSFRAVVISALLFGIFHVATGSMLMVERLLPSTFLGLLLGWIAVRTGSLWPGVIVHALHNGFMLSLSHFEPWLIERGWGTEQQIYLPLSWLGVGSLMFAAGSVLLWWGGRSGPQPAEVDQRDEGGDDGS
jgi:ABC-2 type transport system permease protein/sodium transport system permease protein